MRALNTIGRPIITGEATIGGGAAGRPIDLGALFQLSRGDVTLVTNGRVAGAAHQVASVAKPGKTVQLSDGTSIAFSSVRADEY